MDVFNLQSTISLDSSSFFSGLRKSERGMKDFGDKMAMGFDRIKQAAKWLITGAAVKVGVNAIKSLATATANAGDRIDKASQALGLSRKAYQEWEYILSQSGATIDSLGISMKTLTNAIVDGSQDTNDALSTIGLAVSDLEGLSQEQAFEKVVRAFQRLPAGVQKSSAAVKLFGRNGQELLPLLNSDIYSIDILRAKAMDLGMVMSDDAVNASVAYTDALDTLQRTFNGLRYSIGAKVLPVLTTAFTRITNYAGKISRAYKDEGLSGVFKTVISDIRNIKWPSWDDVEKAATKAWDDIKKGALTLGGLVFGKKEDGSVDWPGWPEVVGAANAAWEGIKDGALTLVGLILGKKADGSVNWPTWSDVVNAATKIWKDIKKNALDLGGVVFGRREDGSVNWPTWKDVQDRANEIWKSIKNRALNLGGVIFGLKEDGSVNWPDWNSVKDAGLYIWGIIKEKALNIGAVVFGRKEDGSVNWPTWKDVQAIGTGIWNGIKEQALNIGAIVFGRKEDGRVNWPTWKDVRDAGTEIWNTIKGMALDLGGIVFGRKENGKVNWPQWKDVKDVGVAIWKSIKDAALNLGGIIFGRKENGRVNWPTWKDVKDAGIEIWEAIKGMALGLGGVIFGRKENGKVNWPTWKDVKDAGIAIWNYIKDKVSWFGGLIFGKNTKGEVNWPTLKDLTDAADALWKDVVGYVGKLGGLIFGDSPEAVTVFQEIAKAIGAISAAVLAYGFYTKLSQTVSLLRSFFTLDISGFSKAGLILAGIAAGMMLIYEHWTDIEPAMRSIGEWITNNVIAPITNAISAIEDLLYEVGLIKKEADIKESIGIVDPEKTPVRIPVAWGDKISPILAKYFGWGQVDKFGESLTNAIETKDFTSFVDQVIKEMISADKTSQQTIDAVEELRKACSEVAGEYPITFPINYPLTIQQYVRQKQNEQLSSHSGSGGSFESGLWDVPYNDFPALLHEGEMVLTKTQANEYRDGGGSGASSRMIVSAIQKLENTMANLRLMVGEKEFGRATTEYGGRRMNNYIGAADGRIAAGYGS